MGYSFSFPWEVTEMEWLQTHISATGISIISAFSLLGEPIMLVLILGFLYWSYDKNTGKIIGKTVLFGLTLNTMLKNIVLRRRPYFDHPEIKLFRTVDSTADIYDIKAQGYSFPSGHATNSVTLYGFLALKTKKKWMRIPAVILPLLVGFSRIVVGAHYPTDVLGGWAVGIIAAAIISILQIRFQNTALLHGILMLLVIPGLFYCQSEDYFTNFGLLTGLLFGSLIEEKFINFKDAKSPVKMILRLLGGITVYYLLNVILKAPFSNEFLESGTRISLLVRAGRYAIIAFVDFGIYPMLFRFPDNRKS